MTEKSSTTPYMCVEEYENMRLIIFEIHFYRRQIGYKKNWYRWIIEQIIKSWIVSGFRVKTNNLVSVLSIQLVI